MKKKLGKSATHLQVKLLPVLIINLSFYIKGFKDEL